MKPHPSGHELVILLLMLALVWPLSGYPDEPVGVSLGKTARITASTFPFKRKAGVNAGKIQITNRSRRPIHAPLTLVVTGTNRPGAALVNAAGRTPAGQDYITLPLPGGQLGPGKSLRNITLTFQNPTRKALAPRFALYGLLAPNRPPTASAGADRTVALGSTVILDGSGSTDPDGQWLVYHWTLSQRPPESQATLVEAHTLSPQFTADQPGSYQVQLVVSDRITDSAPDSVTLGTANSRPQANAGPHQTVPVGATAWLDGSASRDPDGDPLRFQWSVVSRPTGSTASVADPTARQTAFVPDRPGRYDLQLVVNDGQSDSDPVHVILDTRNSAPVAEAGPDQSGFVGHSITLDGAASHDVDGDALSFRWALVGKPEGSQASLVNPAAQTARFTPDRPGTYVAQLIVHDGHADSQPDTATIAVPNRAPTAEAGPDRTAFVGTEVALDGAASTDPDGDPLTYRWTLLTRPDASQSSLTAAQGLTTRVTLDRPGTYQIQLVVNDGHTDSAPDLLTISTENSKPVAQAGPDQTIPIGGTLVLDGTASQDIDGDILSYWWSLPVKPANSSTALSGADTPHPSFTPDAPGHYEARLVVNDGRLDSEPDTVAIDTRNSKPVAQAGPDQPSRRVGEAVTLDGSASTDVDHDPLQYRWSMLTRPPASQAALSHCTAALCAFAPDQPGDYVAQLIVHDGVLDSDPDTALIRALSAPRIVSTPSLQALAGQLYRYDPQVEDLDGTAWLWSLTTKPDGMAVSPVSGEIAWTPTAQQAGAHGVTLRVEDADHLADTQSFTLTVPTPSAPSVTSTPPAGGGQVGQPYLYQVAASDADSPASSLQFSLSVAPDGAVIDPLGGLLSWTPLAGQLGPHTITIRVQDPIGLTGEQSYELDVGLPPGTLLVPNVVGQTRAQAEAQLQQVGLNLATPVFLYNDTAPEGQILVQSPAADSLQAVGAAVTLTISLGPDVGLPPDPVTVAPPVNPTVATTVAAASEFLYAGASPIQTGVAEGTIETKRAAVLSGRVLDKQNNPLPGVTVTVEDHPEFGQTLSRADGQYDLAVNGGGYLSLNFQKTGYLPIQRQVNAPWQDYMVADDAVMIALDSKATTIDLTSSEPMQAAQGNPVTDQDGTRQATLMIPQGTKARVYNPDGSLRETSTLTLHLTEYTVGDNGPAAMPGPLPPTSGYTYAVELKAEEGALKFAGRDVVFDRPVPFYVDNFLNMPVGIQVPVAYWDKEKSAWIPSDDGRVIKILSISSGLADIDSNGDSVADSSVQLAAMGFTAAEREKLAGYPVGKTLWRALVTHLSTYDLNFGVAPPPGAKPPQIAPPESGDGNKPDNQCHAGGSDIECQSQILGESLPVTGTAFTLHYASDRVPGRKTDNTLLNIPLSGNSVPDVLKRIDLEIEVAGRKFTHSSPALPNKTYTFEWDGKDKYGRDTSGNQSVITRIGYIYDGYYVLPPLVARSFGVTSGQLIPGQIPARQEVALWQETKTSSNGGGISQSGFGAWMLDIHHAYDPNGKVLYLGDGSRRSTEGANAALVIDTVAGTGEAGFSGDGGPATQAPLSDPVEVAYGPDGSLFIADYSGSFRVRRVAPDGTISTVAGKGVNVSSGDGGLAVNAQLGPAGLAVAADSTLYVADHGNNRIRKITPDGIITTIAGTGTPGFSGDGGPATTAQLYWPQGLSLGADNSVYIADLVNNRIRRIGPDGTINTVAGTGAGGYSGDGGSALSAGLNRPTNVNVGSDGSLLIAGNENFSVRRVGAGGIITTVAGTGENSYSGDGGSATSARFSYVYDTAPAPDGGFYVADYANCRVRHVNSSGIVNTIAGNGTCGYGGDGGPATQAMLTRPVGLTVDPRGNLYIADRYNKRVRRVSASLPGASISDLLIPSADGKEVYAFDPSGRHLRTQNARTGALIYRFSYDAQGRLISITDGDGNITSIERDALGNPTAIVAPFGQRTELALDANGYLASVRNPAGETYRMTYTADGLLTEFKDPRGHASTMAYDDLGRLLKDQNAAGGSQNLARVELPLGYEVTRTTGEGRTVKHRVETLATSSQQFTDLGTDGTQTTRLAATDGTTTTTQPDGTVTQLLEGPDPRFGMQAPIPSSFTTTTGGLTSTVTTQRSASLSDPNNPLSLLTLTDTVTLNGRTATSIYAAATKTATATSAAGRVSASTLDNLGRVVQSQVAGLLAVNNSYDAHGRLSTVAQGTDADRRELGFAYNPQGYLRTVTDPLGRTLGYEYDAAGRVTREILPDGRDILYAYDANGNLASLTPPGRPAHEFRYTNVDLTAEYLPPDVGAGTNSTVYEYNLDKDLTRILRPDGHAIAFTYDGAGRLAKQTLPNGELTYGYNATTGKLARIDDPDGGRLAFAYNGALLTQTAWTGAVAGTVGFGYDNDFRVTGVSVNGANTVAYQYDADSLLTQAGSLTLTRSGQNGLLTGTALGKLNDSYAYNGFGEVTGYQAKIDSALLFKTDYSYDKLGRIVRKVEAVGVVSNAYDYGYDQAGRLAEVKLNGATTATYAYDDNGNRLSRNGIAGTYDNQDRLLTYGGASYTYTANGELKTKTVGGQVTEYVYDVLGNLRQVKLPGGHTLDYVIDAANRRVGKKVDGTLAQGFLYQDQLKPVAELDGGGAIVSRFVYATHANVPDYLVKGGQTYRIVIDHLGSPRFVVNTADGTVTQQMEYDEFGNVVADSNPGFQPFGFAGGLYDRDTGLVRFGARDYDAGTGRWLAKDPILFGGQDANLYGYVGNMPLSFVDIEGLEADFLKKVDKISKALQKTYRDVQDIFENDPWINESEISLKCYTNTLKDAENHIGDKDYAMKAYRQGLKANRQAEGAAIKGVARTLGEGFRNIIEAIK
jgi:RHS repeat-associated protein